MIVIRFLESPLQSPFRRRQDWNLKPIFDDICMYGQLTWIINISMDSFSLEGITTSLSCFHIQTWAFLLKQVENCGKLNDFLQTFMCHTLLNPIQNTFPTFKNIMQFFLNMLTIINVIKCTFRNTKHGGTNFLPTNMFRKSVKLGNKKFFLTHNLCTNLAPSSMSSFKTLFARAILQLRHFEISNLIHKSFSFLSNLNIF